jgi:hypothetical protein
MAVLTQAAIWTEFNTVIPAEVKQYLRAHIVGPQGELHRYSDPDEKVDIAVGPYVDAMPTTYPWPAKEADSLVDLDSVAVFIDNALLRYFTDPEGGGSGTITPVALYLNRIITNAASGFKENGVLVRDPLLFDRDVQIGDVVHVKHLTSELWTTVRSLIGTVIPATIAAATFDPANPATQGFSDTNLQTAGLVNDVAVVENGAAYNGLESGFINETYTVLVVQGSVGGDATTAKVNVTAGSGTDNATNVVPAAFGVDFALGTRGALMRFTHVGDDLVVGQTWLITIAQAFTRPIPTSGGTYTGAVSQTYIIEVIDGGLYTDVSKPKVVVTSNLGIDSSGPTDVPAAVTNVIVGTFGVLIQFTGTQLRKGDKYYIVVTGPGVGAYKTIELNDNLPAPLLVAPDMLLELHIKKNLPVPQQRVSSPPTLNWTASQGNINLNSGIDATDSTLTNLGVEFYVPVVSGPTPPIGTTVYISYRAWSTAWCAKVGELSDPLLVESVIGTVTPENPLAYAVFKALLNANGQTVNFTGICDPDDLALWEDAFTILEGLNISTIVPLTFDADVGLALQDHVDAQSQDEVGSWRHGWLTLQATQSVAIVDEDLSSDDNVVLATLGDDPGTAGTQYTYFTVTTGNAKFVTKGVRLGDKVRYLFTVDLFGNPSYTEFTVATVVNEDTLIVSAPGNPIAVGVAQKLEVWRNQTSAEMSAQLAAQATAMLNKRMIMLWPDQVDAAEGSALPGYFLTAAFAGFVNGVAPHQGIETVPILGFTAVPRSTSFFNNGDLNTLAAGGVFVVSQSGSEIFAKFARTTDQSSADNKWELVVRNDDAVRRVIYGRVARFFGISNLTQAALVIIRSEIESAFFMLESATYIDRIDRMVLSHSITDIRVSTTSPDTIVVVAVAERPIPIGALQLELIFIHPIISITTPV